MVGRENVCKFLEQHSGHCSLDKGIQIEHFEDNLVVEDMICVVRFGLCFPNCDECLCAHY